MVLPWPLKMGSLSFPETSVRNNHYTLRNSPKESSSSLLARYLAMNTIIIHFSPASFYCVPPQAQISTPVPRSWIPPAYICPLLREASITPIQNNRQNYSSAYCNTVCPTRYRTRHFFNNSNTNKDIATKFEQEYVRCVRNEEECVCNSLQISLQYPHWW